MQYESSVTSDMKVMAKVKVFVHAHTDVDSRAMTLAPQTPDIHPRSLISTGQQLKPEFAFLP